MGVPLSLHRIDPPAAYYQFTYRRATLTVCVKTRCNVTTDESNNPPVACSRNGAASTRVEDRNLASGMICATTDLATSGIGLCLCIRVC